MQVRYLKVFLSSPGDVPEERAIARRIIKRLPNRYMFRYKVALSIIAWDDPEAGAAMEASLSPQEAINKELPRPSECDIVIVILWSRLGTPFTDTDGKKYESGTHWELLDALRSSSTKTYIYKRTEEPKLGDINAPQFRENLSQHDRLKKFLESDVFYENGEIKRSVTQYESPSAFEELFELQFEQIVGRILSESVAQPHSNDIQHTPNRNIEIAETTAWPSNKSPFPGLRSFDEADADIFFGRSQETDALVRQVTLNRFAAVVGASGSGKSSLVGAGLIPRLRANAIPGSKDWFFIKFTPGKDKASDPFESLAESLIKTIPALRYSGKNMFEIPKYIKEAAAQISSSPDALLTTLDFALEDHPKWTEVLLFIDQFEELFTLSVEDQIEPFIRMLVSISKSQRVRAVITMRADFYHQAITYQDLSELLRTGSFPLAAPRRDALRQMIERPAERAGLQFDENLVNIILDDTGDEPGNLALMAYTLDELYNLWHEGAHSEEISFQDYEALGRVQGAIGKRAEDIYHRLPAESAAVLPRLARLLVEVNEQGLITRQGASLEQIRKSDGILESVVSSFVAARLLVVNNDTLEIAHEALLRSWPRLQSQIIEMQEDLRLLAQVRTASRQWRENGYDPVYRWPHERLVLVYEMLDRLRLEDVHFVERLMNDPDFSEFIKRESEVLLDRLYEDDLSHYERERIGARISNIGDVRAGLGLDADCLPQIEWIVVEGGDEYLYDLDTPVPVADFWIAKYPVTIQQYQAFLDDPDGFSNPEWWLDGKVPESDFRERRRPEDVLPVDFVSWYDAVAFCRWLTSKHEHHALYQAQFAGSFEIRLPTEWEWQRAGTNGIREQIYPWGSQWNEKLTNSRESGLGRAVVVGLYPQNISPSGVVDMSGNISEWCLNERAIYQNIEINHSTATRSIRGGAWNSDEEFVRLDTRAENSPSVRNNRIGFRVCLSMKS